MYIILDINFKKHIFTDKRCCKTQKQTHFKTSFKISETSAQEEKVEDRSTFYYNRDRK